MNKLIGISGRRGSGKDTFLELLNEQIMAMRDGIGLALSYHQMSFADPLKDMAAVLTGENPALFRTQEGKTGYLPAFGMTRGELLQRMGTDALRNGLMDDVWIRSMHARRTNDAHALHAITDCRFPNEADYVHSCYGALIRINGDPLKQQHDGSRDDKHPSEVALDDYADFDFIVLNNGTLGELRLAALRVFRALANGIDRRLTLTIDAHTHQMWADAKPFTTTSTGERLALTPQPE